MNDYERKFERAVGELSQAGLWEPDKLPYDIKFQRQLGFQPKPEWYRPVLLNFIREAVVLAVLLLGVKMVFGWRPGTATFVPMVLVYLVLGMFLAGMGVVIRRNERKKHNLSRWDDL